MDISLSGYENFIKEQMSTGLYKSVNEIVNEAMSLLKLKKSISQERIDALNADIQMGIDDIKAGRTMDGETAFKKLMSKYE
jgi:antitoxin ParD1/3/4